MAVKKIMVTGAGGMLGRELMAYLTAKGFDVHGTTTSDLNLLGTQKEITDKILEIAPQVIVHGAAFTNVDEAENQPEIAMAVNKDGARKMALAAKEVDAILAYVSTDYVFDGLKQAPYTPEDRPNPVNTYGLSKYYGELMVTELMEAYYIIRTSWLYGIHRRNFVQFVVDAVKNDQRVNITDDQFGSPTWTGSLAVMIENIVTSGAYGTYHASDDGAVSRYEQALEICRAAGLSSECIRPIVTRDFPQAANRPMYTALKASELSVPSWETSLRAYLEQYLNAAAHS